ncbi:MAG: Amidohydrolase 3 [Candidatus Acidoferrum typicum]|nr:Amidohydrolase 3 [Candidatus Acidoferrum typicum]
MRLRNPIPAILAVAVFFTSVAWAGADKTVERIFYNGKIFTGDPEHPYAEAVVIRGDKIVAVGNSTDIARTADRDAEKIDLRGKMLLPGLIDSHVHAIDGGVSLDSADVGDSVHTVVELTACRRSKKIRQSSARRHPGRQRYAVADMVQDRRAECPVQHPSV